MPGARFSKTDAITETPAARAACESFSVVGPGMGSARSNREASSRWQKYCVRKSSGRQTTCAPRLAAACTCSTARFKFSSGSAPQRSWTRPTRKFWALDVDIVFDFSTRESVLSTRYSVLRTKHTADFADHADFHNFLRMPHGTKTEAFSGTAFKGYRFL